MARRGSCGGQVLINGQTIDLPADTDPTTLKAVAIKPDGSEALLAFPATIVRLQLAPDINQTSVIAEDKVSSAVAVGYVEGLAYEIDEKMKPWQSGTELARTDVSLPPEIACYPSGITGGAFAYETYGADSDHLWIMDVHSGAKTDIPLPASADTCAAIAFSSAASIGIRTTAEYQPAPKFHGASASPVEQLANPLRQSAGLQTVLMPVSISMDASRLIAGSNGEAVAIFDLNSMTFVASVAIDQIKALEIAPGGTVAFIVIADKVLKLELDPTVWMQLEQSMISAGTGKK